MQREQQEWGQKGEKWSTELSNENIVPQCLTATSGKALPSFNYASLVVTT